MRKMRLWRTVSAFVLAAVLVTGCGGGGSSSAGSQKDSAAEAEVTEEKTTDEAQGAQEDTATGENKESEDLAVDLGAEDGSQENLNSAPGAPSAASQVDTTIELEGKKYTLPMPISELLADGYYVDADLDTEIGGLTYTWCHLSKEEGSYGGLTIDVFNGSGNTKPLSECMVSGIDVASSDLENFSFALGNGLKPGDLPETVEQIMGTPTNQSDSDTSLTYYYGEGRRTGQITFSWWKEDGEFDGSSQLSVEYFAEEQTSTSTEVPEYLSEYKAPTEMGEDFDSGTITLDGVIYQLSCPVSEFVKNGWTIDDDDEVMADRTGIIYLTKGGVEITLYVRNLANYQTIGSNCIVYKISGDTYSDTDPIPDLTLPKGLSFKTDLSTLESIIDSSSVEISRDEDDDSITYSCYNYDLNIEIYISYDKEKSKIVTINYERDMWP